MDAYDFRIEILAIQHPCNYFFSIHLTAEAQFLVKRGKLQVHLDSSLQSKVRFLFINVKCAILGENPALVTNTFFFHRLFCILVANRLIHNLTALYVTCSPSSNL